MERSVGAWWAEVLASCSDGAVGTDRGKQRSVPSIWCLTSLTLGDVPRYDAMAFAMMVM